MGARLLQSSVTSASLANAQSNDLIMAAEPVLRTNSRARLITASSRSIGPETSTMTTCASCCVVGSSLAGGGIVTVSTFTSDLDPLRTVAAKCGFKARLESLEHSRVQSDHRRLAAF
jgi:hypothetical protein